MIYGAAAADLKGSLLIQAGVIGEVCVAVFCTDRGSATIFVNVLTGDEESSVVTLSAPDTVVRGEVRRSLAAMQSALARARRPEQQ